MGKYFIHYKERRIKDLTPLYDTRLYLGGIPSRPYSLCQFAFGNLLGIAFHFTHFDPLRKYRRITPNG